MRLRLSSRKRPTMPVFHPAASCSRVDDGSAFYDTWHSVPATPADTYASAHCKAVFLWPAGAIPSQSGLTVSFAPSIKSHQSSSTETFVDASKRVAEADWRPENRTSAAGSLTTLGEPNNDTLTYATKRIATSCLSAPI
jgi:hypothetical protein